MSKSPFWGTVSHVFGAYLYSAITEHENLLKSIDYEQRDLFFRRLTQEFASATTNTIEKYGEDLEKMKVNGLEKRKLGQGRNSGTD